MDINNTSPEGGALNTTGITVVSVQGTVAADAFVLAGGPVDGGFYSYDLFAEPGAGSSTDFKLKSFVGPGANVLPQLLMATNDIWHSSSGTWADRTADLRASLGGDSWKASGSPGSAGTGPGVWARFSGEQLDRSGSVSIDAYDTTHDFDLGRSLRTNDLQVGIDFGQRDFSTGGDAFAYGVMGGIINGSLNYNALDRQFNFEGGQFGGYATYMSHNLFIDALLKADFYQLGTRTSGFPETLAVRTFGARVDAGYRMGGKGMFVEPLATIAAASSSIEGFTVGTNTVEFGDATSIRGRLGGRIGSTMYPTEETKLEPFLAVSLWGEFGGDKSAQFTSEGESFSFSDGGAKNWTEISAGVNLFNNSEGSDTAAFAKVDATIGSDIKGLGGQVGWRFKW